MCIMSIINHETKKHSPSILEHFSSVPQPYFERQPTLDRHLQYRVIQHFADGNRYRVFDPARSVMDGFLFL